MSGNFSYLYGSNLDDPNLLASSPVLTYLNADTEKLSILKDNRGKSGVYRLTNPWFLTGFIDAEASFMIKIRKSSRYRLGWSVEPVFQIELHKKDLDLLNFIQVYFQGKGSISKVKDCFSLRICSLEQIYTTILPHLDNYPLITQKHTDYLLFKKVILMMLNKEHFTQEGA